MVGARIAFSEASLIFVKDIILFEICGQPLVEDSSEKLAETTYDSNWSVTGRTFWVTFIFKNVYYSTFKL